MQLIDLISSCYKLVDSEAPPLCIELEQPENLKLRPKPHRTCLLKNDINNNINNKLIKPEVYEGLTAPDLLDTT